MSKRYMNYEGLGTLIGEFVPFLVALTVMFAINIELTITFSSPYLC